MSGATAKAAEPTLMPPLAQRLVAETLGTAFLLATVIGSGIMAQRLAGGNVALALLGNTLPTGAILVVLILIFGPLSGAHFNPVVSLAFALRRALSKRAPAGSRQPGPRRQVRSSSIQSG